MIKNAQKVSVLDLNCPLACIEDEGYADYMKNTAEPYIASRRDIAFCEPRAGQKLRYVKYTADEPRGTVVISHGFTETLEKYDETVYYLLQRGYNAFLCEHRGHGLSYRETEDFSLAHVVRFADYVEDILFFINRVVKPQSAGDISLLAHSMGGAVGALAMEK